MILKKKD